MLRRSAATRPSQFDESFDPAGLDDTLSVMEMGDCEQQRHHHQQTRELEERGPRVTVAATEAINEEGEHREGIDRANRLLAEGFRVVLIGLLAVFACYFVYVWVDSFRKGRFNPTLGVVTVTFCGLVVFAWINRWRLRSMTLLPNRTVGGGSLQRRPKRDTPTRAQESFQYFVYPKLSSSNSGSETSIASSDDGSGVGSSSTTFAVSAERADDTENPDGESHIASREGGAGNAEAGESATCAGEVAAITPAFGEEARGESGSVDAEDDATSAPPSPPSLPPLQYRPGKEGRQRQTVGQDSPLQKPDGPEQQRHEVQGHPERAKERDSSLWSNCSVCLEAFSAGDSACRTPCGHIFHAECINIWLDENNCCPECRLDLLNEDDADAGGEPRSEDDSPESSPGSSLPDEAFQISFSNRTSTATEQAPTIVTSSRNSTTSSTHPEPLEAQHPGSPDRAFPARTADLTPANTKKDVAELTTVVDTTDSDSEARREAPEAAVVARTASCLSGHYMQSSSSLETSVVPFQDIQHEPEQKRRASQPSNNAAPTLEDQIAPTAEPSSVAPHTSVLDSPDYEAPTSPTAFARQLQQFAVDSGRSSFPPTSTLTTEDVTDLNTAINAMLSDNGASAAGATVAPYACYFGSPCTQSSSSLRTPVVRFEGLSPEFGETTGACRPPRTPERTVAPYRDFFNSPGSPSSPSPVSTAMVPFRGSPSGVAAAAAPFACYLDSPLHSPPRLAPADLAGLLLSPEFVRLRGAAGDAQGFRGVPGSSPLSPPTFTALSFPQGTSSLPRIGAGSSRTTLVARAQQQHQRKHRVNIVRENNGGQAHRAPQRTGRGHPQRVPAHLGLRGQVQEGLEATSPPRPPPRLAQRPSPEFAGDDQELPPPPPPPLSYATPARLTVGQQNNRSRLRSSPQLVQAGGASMKNRRAASASGRPGQEGGVWVWPIGSDPMWDNRACVSVGDRGQISSLDEGAGVRPQERKRQYRNTNHQNEGMVGASSGGETGGRWVWQPDPIGHHPHRQYWRQQQHQMMFRHHHDGSFEEESLSEAEEHDELFWDRVMYHIWA